MRFLFSWPHQTGGSAHDDDSKMGRLLWNWDRRGRLTGWDRGDIIASSGTGYGRVIGPIRSIDLPSATMRSRLGA